MAVALIGALNSYICVREFLASFLRFFPCFLDVKCVMIRLNRDLGWMLPDTPLGALSVECRDQPGYSV